MTLTLDDTAGAVPPPFHEQSELEIIRRIERGSGSEYRVNGKEVRARDVQTLFADLATGAHASGMVSQGRVGALVTAKPEDRRAVLEEAAGITGLHVRRHEAELKLRAAEANLARADDLRGQLEAQLGALKRQARQASRYRNISGAIRQAEAELLAIQRARTSAAARRSGGGVARRAHGGRRRHRGRDPGRDARPPMLPPRCRRFARPKSDARTALERHRVTQEQIAAEEERARTALADATMRLSQLGQDLAHAEQLSKRRLEAAESRLAAEDAGLAEADAGYPMRAETAEATVAAAVEAVRIAEAASQSRHRGGGRGQCSRPDRDADSSRMPSSAGGGWTSNWRRCAQSGIESVAQAIDPVRAGGCRHGAAGRRGRSRIGACRAGRSRAGPRGHWSCARRPRASDRPQPTRHALSWQPRRARWPKYWR